MKRIFLTALLGLAISIAMQAKVKVTVTPIEDATNSYSHILRTISTKDLLLNEDFNTLTSGSHDSEPTDPPISTLESGFVIDPSLTHGNVWQAHYAYSADGAICLRSRDGQEFSLLNTPAGDYSGSVILEFNMRALDTHLPLEDGSVATFKGASVFISLLSDSGREFNLGDDMAQLANVRTYENQGWCNVRIEFDNYSAYNDARFSFYTTETVVLDDIKISSSADNFIAAPTILGVTDVKENGFTINFEPVRKAFNYYVYLYTLKGYDEQTGEPIYYYVKPGQTPDEYKELKTSSPYHQYGIVKSDEPCSFTFTDLEPDIDYYYAIRSHFINTFSDKYDITKCIEIPTPELEECTAISNNSFTVNWQPVTKADRYGVDLYGVSRADEDVEDFIIFEESFDNVGDFTDASDIMAPDEIGTESDLNIDDLTSTPGWQTNMWAGLLVDGYYGINETNSWLITPNLYVANSDELKVSIRAEFIEPVNEFYIMFNNVEYGVLVNGTVFEDEFILPTGGVIEAPFYITGPEMGRIFIDYLIFSQDLKKGNHVFTWLGAQETEDLKHTFSELDTDLYKLYGYSVRSLRGEGINRVQSVATDRVIVDFDNNHSYTSGTDNLSDDIAVEIARYSIDGRKIAAGTKGMQIVRYSNGSVRKIIEK